jgi:predicted porin
MKKSLIALAALSAFAGSAAAQSSVTVYGILDVSYGTVESKTAAAAPVTTKTTTAGQDGIWQGSRLGFKGTEDLGGGTSAIFQIELGLNPTEGGLQTTNAGGTNRNTFVGLQSAKLGTIKAGRMPTLNKLINDSTVFGGSTLGAGWVTQVNGSSISNERQSNMIEYTTPTFAGLTAAVQIIKDKTDKSDTVNSTKNEGTYLGLSYKAGALDLRYANKNVKSGAESTTNLQDAVAAYGALVLFNPTYANTTSAPKKVLDANGKDISSELSSAAITEKKVKQDSVLASYDFGVAKVVATYNTTKTTTLGDIATPKSEDLTLGVSVPVGAWNFVAQYGEGDQSTGVAGAAKTDVKGYQVGALYNLSKRTAVYGLYGDHETKADGAAYKASADAFAVGVRHSF